MRGTSFFSATNAEGHSLASVQPLVSEGPCSHVWVLTAPQRGPRPADCGGSRAPPPTVLENSLPFLIFTVLTRYKKDLHLPRYSPRAARSNPSPKGPDGIRGHRTPGRDPTKHWLSHSVGRNFPRKKKKAATLRSVAAGSPFGRSHGTERHFKKTGVAQTGAGWPGTQG